ncbi:MAG: helix-turn-helix domain-containing protein [Candidatus Ratteibacteria bacterium]
MRPIFVKKITKKERELLLHLMEKGHNYLKKRARAIFLSGVKRYEVKEIAGILGFHPNHLRKWIHRYNEAGIKAIVTSPARGIRKKFNDALRDRIINLVHVSPRKLGLKFSRWTLCKLKQYVESKEWVEKISYESIRLMLKEKNIDLKKMRYETEV